MTRAKIVFLAESGGDLDEIEKQFRQCIDAQQELLGDDHPEVLVTLNEYSAFLLEHAKLETAEHSYRLLLSRQIQRLGEDHVACLGTLSSLAEALDGLDLPEAEEMYRRATALATALDGGATELSWHHMNKLATYLRMRG